MGRLKTFNREEAVQTVMHELWLKGYEACSVKSLSETLGMTRSSFYNAFGSREALFLETLQVYAEQSPDRVLGQIDNGDPILQSLCEMFKKVCLARASDTEHRGCLVINSIIELVGIDETVGPILSSAVQNGMGRLEYLLGLAVEKGELECDDIRNTAMALQNTLIGINVLCKVVHDSDSLWRSTRATLLGLKVYKPSFEL